MKIRHLSWLAACIIGCELVGLLSGLLSLSSISTWYSTLNRASFTPPSWAFGPAWTVLYLLMGASLYLAISRGASKKGVRLGIALFLAQLTANFLWSIIFFGMRSIAWGLADIAVMAVLISATIAQFYTIRRSAAYLMVPYLAWTLFALSLNYHAFVLNP